MVEARKRPTDWRKRFAEAKPSRTVVLHADFAGIKAGTTMFIGSPDVIANYVARIPKGETIERLRNELARQHGAQASCPVTTAIYLRIVAEVALRDLADGRAMAAVVPFWRVISADSKIAKKLMRRRDDRALPAARRHRLTRFFGRRIGARSCPGSWCSWRWPAAVLRQGRVVTTNLNRSEHERRAGLPTDLGRRQG